MFSKVLTLRITLSKDLLTLFFEKVKEPVRKLRHV